MRLRLEGCLLLITACSAKQVNVPICGNGIVEPPEQCDDGSRTARLCPEDSSTCQLCGHDCTLIQAGSQTSDRCGDGTPDAPLELCDDGANNNDAWSADRRCNTLCNGWAPFCGDGVLDADNELCDPLVPGGPACSATCDALLESCGDGNIDNGEACGEPGTACERGESCLSCVCLRKGCTQPSFTLEATIDGAGASHGMRVANDLLFLVDRDQGLLILDISDLQSPTQLGQQLTTGEAVSVDYDGRYAYVGLAAGGFDIVDTNNPAETAIVNTFVSPGRTHTIEVRKGRAFIAGGADGGLTIVDISTPTAPAAISRTVTPDVALAVAVSSSIAAVADRDKTQLIDIGDESDPEFIGNCCDSAWGVAIDAQQLYVGHGTQGLSSYSLATPATPQDLYNTATPGFTTQIDARNGHLYVVNQAGLMIVDTQSTLQRLHDYATPGESIAVEVVGNRAFVLDRNGDITVLKLCDSL